MANYIYAFDSGVYDVSNMGNPAPINADANSDGWGGTFPMSAANNSFSLVSAGKVNHEDVEGVLFNYVSVGSAAPIDQDFTLVSPGGPDHPDYAATAIISLSATPSTTSYMQLETTQGNLSTFFAVASAVADSNVGDTRVTGSAFYSNTGTNTQVLQSFHDVVNAGDAFTAEFAVNIGEVAIDQNTAGLAGNTTITVSGTDVVNVVNNFSGGADEQANATYIRAAAGTNSSQGYDGANVAVVTTTGRTVIYTLDHNGSIPPVLSGFNLATGPNMRREVLMGYR